MYVYVHIHVCHVCSKYLRICAWIEWYCTVLYCHAMQCYVVQPVCIVSKNVYCPAMLCHAMQWLRYVCIVSKNVLLPFHSKRRTSTKIDPQDLMFFISTFHPTSVTSLETRKWSANTVTAFLTNELVAWSMLIRTQPSYCSYWDALLIHRVNIWVGPMAEAKIWTISVTICNSNDL